MLDKSLIVKPAGADCNFDCDYCFYLRKSELYPEVNLEGEPLHVPPSNGRPNFARAPCLPFSRGA